MTRVEFTFTVTRTVSVEVDLASTAHPDWLAARCRAVDKLNLPRDETAVMTGWRNIGDIVAPIVERAR